MRKRLPRATNFATLFECFDERIASVPELWDHSQLREHEFLVPIAVAAIRVYQPGFEACASRLFEIGNTGFWHGSVVGSHALCCLFYDESVELGLITARSLLEHTSETAFFRFRRVVLGESPSSSERMAC